MSDRQQIYARTVELIAPYNKKGVAITEATRFAQDLEWDSLTVLDFVAGIEDEFDVIITMNMQAEIETVGQLVDALQRLVAFKRVPVGAGRTVRVELAAPVQALRNWDVAKKDYVVPAGNYDLCVAASSSDVRARGTINIR